MNDIPFSSTILKTIIYADDKTLKFKRFQFLKYNTIENAKGWVEQNYAVATGRQTYFKYTEI